MEKSDTTSIQFIDFTASRKGDIAEIFVSLKALLKGADVFRNLGCDGKTDLVISFKGKVFKVDVKLWTTGPRGTSKPADIYPVIVEACNPADINSWIIRWRGKTHANRYTDYFQPNCPPGLENFWD